MSEANKVVGVIERTNEKKGATNLVINQVWYGFGFGEFPAKVGDNVEFSWNANGPFKNVDQATFKVVGGAAPEAASTPSSSPAGNGRDYNASNTLSYAWTKAIALTDVLLQNEAIKLPAKTKAKDRYNAIMSLTENFALMLAARIHDPDPSDWEMYKELPFYDEAAPAVESGDE